MIDSILSFDYMAYIGRALNESQFAQGAIVISIITAIWASIRSVPSKVWPRIKRLIYYTVVIEQTDELFKYASKWLDDNYEHKFKTVQVGFSRVAGSDTTGYYIETGKNNEVLFTNHEDYIRIWYNYRLLTIHCAREKLEHGDKDNAYLSKMILSGYWSKGAITKLLKQMSELKKAPKKERWQYISRTDSWRCRHLPEYKQISNIFFDKKDDLLNEVNEFTNSREWYNRIGIPYKKGVLLHGPPGTGKTSIAQAFASYLNRDFYIINLNATNNSGFVRLVNDISNKSVILIDDIDICVPQRENDTGKNEKVTLNTLLSFLDGPLSISDTIIFATTNHIEKLDPALIRKGRFDISLPIGHPSKNDIDNYLSNFWGEDIISPEKIFDNYDQPMVNLQNICLQSKTVQQVYDTILGNQNV